MAPARPVRGLTCDDSYRDAAGKIAWTRFDEMMGFAEIALEGRDLEGVHDMRVASRRLRAALEVFQDVFPRKRLRPLLDDVKRLADALGQVRDLDVMLERLEKDQQGRPEAQQLVLAEMIDEMQQQRKAARRELKVVVRELERDEFARRFLTLVAQEAM